MSEIKERFRRAKHKILSIFNKEIKKYANMTGFNMAEYNICI